MKKYITTFSLAKITVCFLVLFATFASAQTGLPGKPNDIVGNAGFLGELKPFWRSQPVLGPYLQDGLNTTEIPNYMLQTDFPYQKRSFATEVPFADNLSVVRLLGGYSKYPGITGTLTDLTTPAGIALLDQLRAYDFVYRNAGGVLVFRPELIQQRLQPYLDLGYEDLTIVLDNIPWDLTTNTNASLSSYGNAGVPNLSQEWYDTVSQLCTTLKTLLGEVKANKLRFRIGTEMNSLERFNGTEAQFITHYDNAAAAIQSVLPSATLSLFNISSNTLSNINTVHNVGAFRVLDHIANENNQKTGAKLTKIPKFVSFSEYFYEGTNLTTEVSNSKDVWNYVNTNIAGYQNKFSREIHEFGGLADWTATIPTENEGAFGGAMTLQVFMKYMEVGVDRIYHWNSFKTIPNGASRYQIPSSQAWTYSVLDYLSGGAVYKIIPETPTIARNATITSIVSVKNGKSYLLVNSFDTDKTNTQVSEVNVRIHKSYLPSNFTMTSTKMASLTNTNCVLNEIRRDVELAGNLNPALALKPDYIPSDFQDLCVDYTAFKAMVLANATKYENLWKDSLTLNSVGGNITQDGDYYVVKLDMTASQNSVVLLQGPLTTGTLTANPTTVTVFPNVNNTGNTALTMTSSNAAKVLLTHQSTGSIISAETIVIDNTDLSFTDLPVDYIKEGATHTFRLYATTAGSSVLGALLSTVIVTGVTPPTGTLTANPATVTTFPNANGTGNTLLTMTSSNAAKVLLTHQSTNGSTTTTEDIVINNNLLSFTNLTANYIQNGRTHTFRLYATTAGSSVLGALLSTVVVTGAAAPTGTLTASPETVTAFTNANGSGNTTLSWSTAYSPRTLITLTKTRQDGSLLAAEAVVVNNNTATNLSFPINYIQQNIIHTFKLYTATGTSNIDYVQGALLDTVIVTGIGPTTGTLTVNPELVTTFPNVNGTGNTLLTMSSTNAAKVLTTHQSTNGSTTTVETIVINDTALSFSDRTINYIQPGRTHTFRLYATEAGSSVLGALLSTVVVTGVAPPPATITASGATTFCAGGSVTLTANAGTGLTYLWSPGGATTSSISASASGSYTVKVTNIAGETTSAPTTVTVNALPTIEGTLSVCIGSTTSLTGSGTPYSTTPWTSASPLVATVDSSGLVTVLTAGTSVITYKNSNGCTITASVIVNGITTQPVAQSICTKIGGTATLSVVSANPAATYQWEVQTKAATLTAAAVWANIVNPATGAAIYSGITAASLVITKSATTTPKTGTLYRVKVTSSCGTETTDAVAITDAALIAAPGTLTSADSALICKYIGTQNLVTFTATPVAGTSPSSYSWTVPSGATINGTAGLSIVTTTDLSIQVNFNGAIALAGAIGSVTVDSNNTLGCSSGKPKVLALTTKVPTAPTSLVMTSADTEGHFKGITTPAVVVDGTTTVPAVYGLVGLNTLTAGIKKVGPYTGTGTEFTLTAQAAVTAASYLWTLPTGVNPTGLSALANGEPNQFTSASSVITVNFADVTPGITALPIVVQSVGGCGNSTARTLSLARVIPSAPTALTLTNSSQANLSSLLKITKVGPYTDTEIPFTLTATPFTTQGAEATSYAWVLPAGVVCTSPSTIGVTSLTGSTVIATVPTPWTITDYITTTTSTITVKFSGATGTGNLALSVYAVNGTGNSIARTLTLARVLPTAPTALVLTDEAIVLTSTVTTKAVTKVSAYTNKDTSLTLTATPIATQGAEATSFTWILPLGVNVISGATLVTNNGATKTYSGTATVLTINFAGTGATSLPLSVYGVNGAGTSALARTLTVTSAVPTAPSITAGATTFSTCASTTTTYTATAIPGATYTWGLPGGATGSSTTNSIVVDFTGVTTAASYAITCIATNGTGPSLSKSLTIKKSTAACRLAPEGVSTNDFIVTAYPNPSSSEFTIKASRKGATGVQVYDMLGRLVEKRQVNSNSVDVGRNYASGIYNVIVTQDANVKILRVIKK